MKNPAINNSEAQNLRLNQKNITDKGYLKEVFKEEYAKYFLLFVITYIIIIGGALVIMYKINNLESNILDNLQTIKPGYSDIKSSDVNVTDK